MALTEEQREQQKRFVRSLDEEDMIEMLMDGDVETADGCLVEPDGICPHGFQSPLRLLGMI